MIGIFVFGLGLVAVVLFLKASSSAKLAAILCGVVGGFVGAGAGLAHSGGATSATFLFSLIGVIIGSVLSDSNDSKTYGEVLGKNDFHPKEEGVDQCPRSESIKGTRLHTKRILDRLDTE